MSGRGRSSQIRLYTLGTASVANRYRLVTWSTAGMTLVTILHIPTYDSRRLNKFYISTAFTAASYKPVRTVDHKGMTSRRTVHRTGSEEGPNGGRHISTLALFVAATNTQV